MNEKNVSQNFSLESLAAAAAELATAKKIYNQAATLEELTEKEVSLEAKPLRAQVSELEEKIEKMYEVVKKMSAERNRLSDRIRDCQGKLNRELVIDALFCKDTTRINNRMDTISDLLETRWSSDEVKVREIKTKWDDTRKGWRVFGFTSDGVNFYLALDAQGYTVSMLKVEKATHAGDTSYTKSFGCQINEEARKELYKEACSREGISFTQWMDQRVTIMCGISWNEVTKRHLGPLCEGSFNYETRKMSRDQRDSMLSVCFGKSIK